MLNNETIIPTVMTTAPAKALVSAIQIGKVTFFANTTFQKISHLAFACKGSVVPIDLTDVVLKSTGCNQLSQVKNLTAAGFYIPVIETQTPLECLMDNLCGSNSMAAVIVAVVVLGFVIAGLTAYRLRTNRDNAGTELQQLLPNRVSVGEDEGDEEKGIKPKAVGPSR